jgi:exopolysaccharide biosynthesis protein
VQLYKTSDSLNGRPFVAYYLSARLRDRSLDFTTQVGEGKRLTPAGFFEKENRPLVVVNGTFFSFQTNQNLNVVVREGKIRAYNVTALKSKQSDSFYYPTRSALGITRKRRADVAWIFTDTGKRWAYAFQHNPVIAKGRKSDPAIQDLDAQEPWEWWKVHTAIGGGPVLVQQGQVRVTNKEEQMFVNGDNDLHPRTAMGYTANGKLIILVIQGRFPGKAEGATLAEEAALLKSLGCEEALNLDGGGSSCMLVNGKETIKPSDKEGQRAVPGVFIIRRKNR